MPLATFEIGDKKRLMRILLLSQHYGPEPMTKVNELAEDLVASGHEVTCLTGFPNYPSGKLYPNYRLRPWTIEWENGVRVVRTFLLPSASKNKIRYSINLASFAVSASILGPLLSKSVDVIYVRHPPLTQGLPALILKYLRRAPLVYAMHDLWPESIAELGMIKNRTILSALDRFERFLMRRADIVGLSSLGFVPNITGKGVPQEKIRILPDWVDERIYHEADESPEIVQKYGMSGKVNIVFAGNMGFVQNLDTILDGAKILSKSAPSVQILMVGNGLERERLEKRSLDESMPNVRFTGSVAPELAADIFRAADGLLVHVRSGLFANSSIASKTYSYMAVGKPILMGAAGTSRAIVEDNQLGLAFEPGNPKSFADVVMKLTNLSEMDRQGIAKRGRELFLSKYSRSAGVAQHEELFRQMVDKRETH